MANVSEMPQGCSGLMLGMDLTQLMESIAREKGVPFVAIYRLTTEEGREVLGRIIDLAHEAWCTEQSKPEPLSFTAHVVYDQPHHEELSRHFGHVSDGFRHGVFDKEPWKPIDRCKDVSRENREITFEYVRMDREASTKQVLAKMDRRGLRPALFEELFWFARKYPRERHKYEIIALGSVLESSNGQGRYTTLCPALISENCGPEGGLVTYWIKLKWSTDSRFLAVRK